MDGSRVRSRKRVPTRKSGKGNRGQGGLGPRAPRGSGANAGQGVMQQSVSSTGFNIRSMPLFALRTRRTLTYYTAGAASTGASVAGGYIFSANGLYDPDISGTGSQPMGFATMMSFYNHYTVLRSRIRVIFQANSSTLRTTVGLAISGSNSVTTSIQALVENGQLSFEVLSYAGAFGAQATLSRAIDVARFQGVPPNQIMADPNMRGDSASNPAEQTYFHLMAWNSASSTVLTADFQVLIEYDTVFHEPRKATTSDISLAQDCKTQCRLQEMEMELRKLRLSNAEQAKRACS